MNRPPATPARPGVRVQVRGLRKGFRGAEVLRGIELTIERGEIFVIMGPSGSGKSVLLRQIIGLDEPDAGGVLIEGESSQATGTSEHFRMAMVFQSAALLNSLTVGENVGLYLAEHRLLPPPEIARVVREKLALLGLEGEEEKLPGELSGGMKRRVAIARALVMEPQLLLYDEPTSELDPLRSVTIGREILELNRRLGVTSVVVTHDRDLACGIAHRVGFLHEGLLRFTGTPAELRAADDPVIREFLTVDFTPASERPPS